MLVRYITWFRVIYVQIAVPMVFDNFIHLVPVTVKAMHYVHYRAEDDLLIDIRYQS